jgi:hypothetical protein
VTENSNESPIQLGQATLEEGEPKFAARKGGGGGARGSRYDHVLDKLQGLEPGKGYVKASLEAGTDKDKAIGAIRVALKRRFGKESAAQFKVRALEGDAIGVFRI